MRLFLPSLVVLSFLSIFVLGFVYADEEKATLESSTTDEVNPVDSYELFWPLVAGKTMDDGFVYNVKLLKEKVRGWFIFNLSKKADYQVFLATKRVLEAEKLLVEEKDELALATLERATKHLLLARDSLERAKNSGDVGEISRLISRAENITKLVSWLATTGEEEIHLSLEKVESEASVLLSDN